MEVAPVADAAVLVQQAPAGDRAIDNETVVTGVGTVYRQRVTIGALQGTWGYRAGTSGTVNIAAGARVIGLAAHSTAGGSFTVNGGDSVPVPAGTGISISPWGQLVAPVLVFTSTDSFFVELLS
jgi:hypothetical protein